MISSQAAIQYCYAFYLLGKLQCSIDEKTLGRAISRWFYGVSLTGRYTGSSESVMEEDLNRIKELTEPQEFIEILDSILASTLTGDYWTITLPAQLETSASKGRALAAYHAAQILLDAPALFSDKKIGDLLDPALKTTKQAIEKHHLFPKAWLEHAGVKDKKQINQVANLAYVEWPDNIGISATPPKVYVPIFCKDFDDTAWERMRRLHALPIGWESMSYDDFLKGRRLLMAGIIRRGFERLSGTDEQQEPFDATKAEQEVWSLIKKTEKNLRTLVRTRYAEHWRASADDRIRKALGDKQWASLIEIRKKSGNQYPLSPTSGSVEGLDILAFSYLGQLIQLMISGEAWELFRASLKDKQRVRQIAADIIRVRNDMAHFRLVPEKEFARCRIAIDDLQVLLPHESPK